MKAKSLIGTTLALSLLLAGCSSTAPANSGQAGADNGEKPAKQAVIKLWGLEGAETEVYNEILPEINAKYPELKVDYSFYPNEEFYNKLKMSPVAGDTPDIVIMDATELSYYVEAGMLLSLDSYMTDDIREDMLPSVINEGTYKDSLYATAQFDSGMSLWANKSMLESAGIRIPTSYTDAWDRAEFEDALAKLKADGVPYPIYIRQNSPKTLYYTYTPIVKSFGGDMMNRETMLTDGALNSEETIAAFDYISWMIEQDYINPVADYEDAFYGRQESALALIGHWKSKEHFEYLGDDAILIPIPDFGNGVYTGSGSVIWAITTAAEKNGVADESWKVLEEAVSVEYIDRMTDVNGGIPARLSVLDSKEEYQEGGRLHLYREQLEAGIGYLRPQTPAHNEIYNVMRAVVGNLLLGSDAREELTRASKDLDEVITENGWNN
ncbi:ABC transporter substrate-binding protein [Paenibacillus daejeonensis]|uniref:ABC transporter substrate-binding protein n=1 Tax=Paenibacillus daejeonensis TaxID=135193 RepID=UPI00036F8F12|nr:extracellular solute-binding protein [Paenibacillus daejeonensis]